VGDFVEMSLRMNRQVASFREVLSEQAVCVLVATSLPWAARVTEVDFDSSRHAELNVPGHFLAAILKRPRFSWTQNSYEYDVQGGRDDQEKSKQGGYGAAHAGRCARHGRVIGGESPLRAHWREP